MKQKITLSDMELMSILDDVEDKIYYGCDQEWFNDPWQRLAGCGPTVAASIIMYQNRREQKLPGMKKSEMLRNMDLIWRYIYPEKNGIASTGIFLKKMEDYAMANDLKLGSRVLDIPPESHRPDLVEVVGFIREKLCAESPVAFLNLDNGAVENLDKWHWVTLCGLAFDDELSEVVATICDEGQLRDIDLKLWLETTEAGGGFVSFQLEEQAVHLNERTG